MLPQASVPYRRERGEEMAGEHCGISPAENRFAKVCDSTVLDNARFLLAGRNSAQSEADGMESMGISYGGLGQSGREGQGLLLDYQSTGVSEFPS